MSEVTHLSRLSDDVDVLSFARRINSSFVKSGLSESPKVDGESEAVYLGPRSSPASIVVFYRYDDLDGSATYYLHIVWTSPKHRGQGCYAQLLEWLKDYAKSKGARRLSTDVHHGNERMIKLKRHWEKTFVRFNLPL
jgi:GNAT superfamily N-acetyltransferase